VTTCTLSAQSGPAPWTTPTLEAAIRAETTALLELLDKR
jgi:hypothetical protein